MARKLTIGLGSPLAIRMPVAFRLLRPKFFSSFPIPSAGPPPLARSQRADRREGPPGVGRGWCGASSHASAAEDRVTDSPM